MATAGQNHCAPCFQFYGNLFADKTIADLLDLHQANAERLSQVSGPKHELERGPQPPCHLCRNRDMHTVTP